MASTSAPGDGAEGVPTPDRTMRLHELPAWLARIASAMLDRHGFYGYTDTVTGEKVKVVR